MTNAPQQPGNQPENKPKDVADTIIGWGIKLFEKGRESLAAIQERKNEIAGDLKVYQHLKSFELVDQTTLLAMAGLAGGNRYIKLSDPIVLGPDVIPLAMLGVKRIGPNESGISLESVKDAKGELVLTKDGFGVRITCTKLIERFGNRVNFENVAPEEYQLAYERLKAKYPGEKYQFDLSSGIFDPSPLLGTMGYIGVYEHTGEEKVPYEIKIRGIRRGDVQAFKIKLDEVKSKLEKVVPELLKHHVNKTDTREVVPPGA